MIYASCPNFHSDIRFVKPSAGMKCVCPGCSTLLQIIKLSPIELDFFDENSEYEIEETEPDFIDDWDSEN